MSDLARLALCPRAVAGGALDDWRRRSPHSPARSGLTIRSGELKGLRGHGGYETGHADPTAPIPCELHVEFE